MPIPKRRVLVVALGLAVILTLYWSGLLSPRPAPRYTVTDLGVLPGDTSSRANAVNSRGEAVGYSYGVSKRACVFGGGQVTSLGILPGGSDSDAQGINSQGEVTGTVGFPATRHAFLDSGGRITDIGTLPGFHESEGMGINDRGDVAVNATISPLQTGPRPQHIFLYSHSKMTNIEQPPGRATCRALGMNNAGQIVGDCGRTTPW